MKIKITALILCVFLLISCTEAVKYIETEDDYYGISENIEENYYEIEEDQEVTGETYLLNTSSKKIHYISCGTGQRTKDKNRQYFTGDIDTLFSKGYTVCGNCFK